MMLSDIDTPWGRAGRWVTESLPVRHSPGQKEWTLEEELIYVDGDGARYTLKPGFLTDGGSIPGLVQPLVGPPWQSPYAMVYPLHDVLCASGAVPRKEADRILARAACLLPGTVMWRTRLIYWGVRIGALWTRSSDERQAHAIEHLKIS